MEDLRGVVSAGRKDHFAAFDDLAAGDPDAGCATTPDDERVDQSVCLDGQVRTRPGSGDIGQEGALPLAFFKVPWQRPTPDRSGPIQVIQFRVPKLEAGRPDQLLEVVERLAFNMNRARMPVVGQFAKVSIGFQAIEVGQASFPAPDRQSTCCPAVVVLRLPAERSLN